MTAARYSARWRCRWSSAGSIYAFWDRLHAAMERMELDRCLRPGRLVPTQSPGARPACRLAHEEAAARSAGSLSPGFAGGDRRRGAAGAILRRRALGCGRRRTASARSSSQLGAITVAGALARCGCATALCCCLPAGWWATAARTVPVCGRTRSGLHAVRGRNRVCRRRSGSITGNPRRARRSG